jgi:hypothetical protein
VPDLGSVRKFSNGLTRGRKERSPTDYSFFMLGERRPYISRGKVEDLL